MKSIVKLTIGLSVSICCFGIAQAADPNPFGDSVAEANGWKQSAWYGWYVDSFYPFVIHAQHGWVYAYPSGDWLWLWDYSLNEWFATAGTVYPMLFEPSGNTWMWYYEGTKGPRWYVEVRSSEVYTEFDGVLMPSLMKSSFDTAMSLTGESSDLGGLLTEGMGIALLALSGDPATSVCPSITRTPETVDLFDPPPTIIANVDFGTGCTPEDGTGEMAGSLDMMLSDFMFAEAGIALDLELTANDIKRDGLALLDGSLAVGFSLLGGTEETETDTHYVTTTTSDIDASLSFTELKSLEEVISGTLNLTGDLISVEEESKADWNDVKESTAGSLTLTMEDFVADELDVTSGTVSITLEMPGITTIDASMQTNDGPIDMEMTIEQSEDGGLVKVNTVGTATVFGYTMNISNLVMDDTQCADYPISGTITITYDSIQYVITVSGDCDGKFVIQKG